MAEEQAITTTNQSTDPTTPVVPANQSSTSQSPDTTQPAAPTQQASNISQPQTGDSLQTTQASQSSGSQGAEQDVQQGSQQNPQQQKQPDLSKPTNPNTPPPSEVHPAVQKASVIHDIAQTLAGGPRIDYNIDPNTGKMVATKVPLTGHQIAQAIALAALSGGIAGLGEKGPGATGRAAQAGYREVQQQQQLADQQKQQQASQDFARQAAITQANFQTHQNALRLSDMEYKYHQQFVDTALPGLNNIRAAGADLASGVHESDLAKYNVTQDMAVPDGTVLNGKNKDGSDHYENTYTIIDPNKKIELPKDTAQLLADLRVPGYFTMVDGKAVPRNFTGSAGIKAGIYVNGMALAQGYQITEAQINRQLSGLTSGDKGVQQFDLNLKKAMGSNSISPKALQTFANYSNLPVDQAVEAMQKDKVDPAIVQQYRQLIPQEAIDASKKQRLDREAADKSVRDTNAAVQRQRAELPGQIALAAQKARVETAVAGTRAYLSEKGRQQAKQEFGEETGALKDMVKDPKINNIPEIQEAPVGGVNQQYLKLLTQANPSMGAVVKAIGEGRQLQSKYGLAKEDGQRLAAIVSRAYPEYSQPKAEAYEKLLNSYTSGKDKDQIEHGNNTYEHLARAFKAAGDASSFVPGTKANKDYEIAVDRAIDEIHGAYSNGVQHVDQFKKAQADMKSHNPFTRREGFRMAAVLLSDKTSEKQVTFRRGKVTNSTPDFDIVSPEAQAAFKEITGYSIGANGFTNHSLSGKPNTTSNFQYLTPDGKQGWDGTKWVPTNQ